MAKRGRPTKKSNAIAIYKTAWWATISTRQRNKTRQRISDALKASWRKRRKAA